MVAKELRTGRLIRLWDEELRQHSQPPFSIDDDSLFVSFYAPAELGCFRVLGWSMPSRILDLFIEYRNSTNTLQQKGAPPIESTLLAALIAHGLPHMDAVEKEEWRARFMRGRPYLPHEREGGLNYCERDVTALELLLPAMLPRIDLGRALLRGRYMAAVSAMEHAGTPIDTDRHRQICDRWEDIKLDLIYRVDADYGVFDHTSFNHQKFGEYLARNNMWWPRTATGMLDTTDETFRDMARIFPSLEKLRGLKHSLSGMHLNDLGVGRDGRNRAMLSPFRARTSRNQPSNSRFIFGPSAWLRSLIRPEPGHGICYLDFSAQEFGIAAALSGDERMIAAYESGDPYLTFAKMARAVPDDATKKTHGHIRDLYKQCALAVMYGMGERGMALKLDQPPIVARELLAAHQLLFSQFWKWSDQSVDHAIRTRSIYTVFGWAMHLAPEANPRALMNFPMQANGAEQLRLACCLATERGVEVCCPIHDAILISAPLGSLDEHVAIAKASMAEASSVVLGGRLVLRSDANVVKFPDRYSDARGASMWQDVVELIDRRGSNVPRQSHG
jgi:hypothetical protein